VNWDHPRCPSIPGRNDGFRVGMGSQGGTVVRHELDDLRIVPGVELRDSLPKEGVGIIQQNADRRHRMAM
jgi:hypothetical protein